MFEGRTSRADEEDQWSRGRQFQEQADRPSGGRGASGSRGFGFDGSRPPAVPSSAADVEERWGKRAPEPEQAAAPAVAASAPAERPRLKLAPRTAPTDGNAAAAATDGGARKSSNPFGAARPREEVLKEKGVDPAALEAAAAGSGAVSPARTATPPLGGSAAAAGAWRTAAPAAASATPATPPDAEAVIAARPPVIK
jgi:hypothetical protein